MAIIKQVSIEGFRAFRKREVITFGEYATILGGPNGTGKTSFFDAVLWGIFGSVSRLRGTRDFVGIGEVVRNRFSSGNEPTSVSIVFDTKFGELGLHKSLRHHTAKLKNTQVELPRAYEVLGLDTSDPEVSFQRTWMLCQEQIADFVTTNPRNRYEWLKTFSGILRLSAGESFLEALETAHTKTQAQLDKLAGQIESMNTRLDQLQRDITSLSATPTEALGFSESDLATEEANLVREILSSKFLMVQNQSASVARIVPLLAATQTRLEKEEADLSSVLQSFSHIEDLRGRLGKIDAAWRSANANLSALKKKNAEVEKEIKRTELATKNFQATIEAIRRQHSEMHSLLEAMLRHITEDRCPVCKREIDAGTLKNIIAKELSSGPPLPRETVQKLEQSQMEENRLQKALTNSSAQQSELQERIRSLADEQESARQAVRSFDERLGSVAKLVGTRKLESLDDIKLVLSQTREQLGAVNKWSEKLAEIQSRRSLLGQTPLLQNKRREAREDSKAKAQLEDKYRRLQETVQLLSSAKEVARDSQVASVGKILQRYSPLIKEVFARLRPHKVFTEFDMEVFPAYREGELFFQAVTPDGIAARIQPYFSMTQRNSVALCIFLALNLSLGKDRRTTFIDDPIHSMDDINILALADLLSALTDHRQLVVSTHDRRVFDLFNDKLRPQGNVDGVRSYWFESWGRFGPRILQATPPSRSKVLPIEEIALRLVAPA